MQLVTYCVYDKILTYWSVVKIMMGQIDGNWRQKLLKVGQSEKGTVRTPTEQIDYKQGSNRSGSYKIDLLERNRGIYIAGCRH